MPFRRTSIDSNQRTGFYSPKRSRVVGGGSPAPLILTTSHTWSNPGVTAFLPQRLGFRFTVGGSSITCRELGVFGAAVAVERVIIHRVSDGVQITSADITSANGIWVDSSVTPVTLSAGVQYVISAMRTDAASRTVYRNPPGLTFNAAIGSISYRGGSDDNQPTSSTANSYAFIRFRFT